MQMSENQLNKTISKSNIWSCNSSDFKETSCRTLEINYFMQLISNQIFQLNSEEKEIIMLLISVKTVADFAFECFIFQLCLFQRKTNQMFHLMLKLNKFLISPL